MCYDPDGEAEKGSILVDRPKGSKVLIEPADECIYYGVGTQIGKITVPEMT